jgi:SUMO ligase MMS21 Smc5/6 complex component
MWLGEVFIHLLVSTERNIGIRHGVDDVTSSYVLKEEHKLSMKHCEL